jgi:hypothetical protein
LTQERRHDRAELAEVDVAAAEGDGVVSADALVVGGNLQIQTGNGSDDSVAITAVSGPTAITGNTQIQPGNGQNDTAPVNGSSGATFGGSFSLQMGNGGNDVSIVTVLGTLTFGGPVRMQFGNGTDALNLAAIITQSGGVPDSQVYFKKQVVFAGGNGKNTRYVGAARVNVFGAPDFDNFC